MKKKGWIALIIATLVIIGACGYVGDDTEPSENETDLSLEENETDEENDTLDTAPDKEDSLENGTEQSGEDGQNGKDEPSAEELPSEEEKQNEKFVLPEYTGGAYTVINNNEPYFEKSELTNISFERYGALDGLGRCTAATACVGRDIMPTEDRGSIGMVKPTGWQTVKYDVVDGKYLYNRCHLIGFQLTGENANEKNLITGTRYMNVDGMLPFENMVADYVKETENHVMYRVTPVFSGDDLLSKGVLMEGYSVEDDGEGICFCVFVHNVQPQIEIDYKDGSSALVKTGGGKEEDKAEDKQEEEKEEEQEETYTYVLNKNTKKFHYEDCRSAKQIKASNRGEFTGTREEIIKKGYSPCGNCDP